MLNQSDKNKSEDTEDDDEVDEVGMLVEEKKEREHVEDNGGRKWEDITFEGFLNFRASAFTKGSCSREDAPCNRLSGSSSRDPRAHTHQEKYIMPRANFVVKLLAACATAVYQRATSATAATAVYQLATSATAATAYQLATRATAATAAQEK